VSWQIKVSRSGPVATPNDFARSQARSVIIDLQQALPSLRRAARSLPAERAAAIITPIEAEIERQRKDAPHDE
jgi:hypothetical protein